MLQSNEYKIYIEKQVTNTIQQVNNININTSDVVLPYRLPSLWNSISSISYPPIFNTFNDGSISVDNLTQICIREMINISPNIYHLAINNEDLQFVIYDQNILNTSTSVVKYYKKSSFCSRWL